MSHRPERKEKDCLNCGTVVQGRYCHFCGQENAVPKETFWQLVTHFVYDLTHFDGNFFSTIKYLLLRPGFLSSEYIKGRRMRYLNPIRMYIFTSAFFFLFFFSVVRTEETITFDSDKATFKEVSDGLQKKISGLEIAVESQEIPPASLKIINDQLERLRKDRERLKTDTSNLGDLYYHKVGSSYMYPDEFSSVQQYDSIQAKLPKEQRAGWLARTIQVRKLELAEKYGRDARLIMNKLFEKFMHSFPQILFVSLPLIALLLRLLYIRRRRAYFYVDHIIYAVHLYCAMFISIFILMCISRIGEWPYMSWIKFFMVPMFIYLFWYIYKSMRNFYRQSRVKTVFKFLLLLLISFFVMTFLFVVFLVLSAYTI